MIEVEVEEEEMEKQINDGTFDECAYVKCQMSKSKMMMIWWFDDLCA